MLVPAHRPSPRAVLLVLGAGLAFAASGPLARWGRPLHPLAIACGRVALASLFLLGIEGSAAWRSLRALSPRERGGILAAGAVLGAHFALFQWGLDETSLPAAISLVSLEPLSVVLWAWVLHGVRPTRPEWIGVGMATLGALLVARGAGVGEHRLLGDALVLGAVVLFGAYISVARRFRGVMPPRHYAALVYAAAALVLGALLVFVRSRSGAVLWPIPPHGALAVLVIALLPTTLGHTAVQAAAQHVSPALVALVSPLESLGGLAISALLLGARPTPTELMGAAIIVAGVSVSILSLRAEAS